MRIVFALALTIGACGPAPAGVERPPAPLPATPAPSAAPARTEATVAEPIDVATGASVVEQPSSGPVVAGGRVDGAALRAQSGAKLRDARWPVLLLRGKSALELGRRVCEQVVPKRPAETPVLVKPNICGFDALRDPAKHDGDDGLRGRITDPEFTRGVIRCLKARGHQRITIAEGCAVGHDMWARVMERSGYRALAEAERVKLVAMDDDGYFDLRDGQPGKPLAVSGMEKSHVATLMLPKILVEHLDEGLFLSLPKLKAHRYSVVSVGIKGMQGVVMRSDKAPAHAQKWRMHAELHSWLRHKQAGREDRAAYVRSLELFAERILDVLEVALPDAVLVDGAPAMSGDGFTLLLPSEELVALGGTNPVLVDKVGAQLLGLWDNAELAAGLGGHRTSPLITAAARRYGLDLGKVRVEGDGAALLQKPRRARYRAIAPFSIGLEEGKP